MGWVEWACDVNRHPLKYVVGLLGGQLGLSLPWIGIGLQANQAAIAIFENVVLHIWPGKIYPSGLVGSTAMDVTASNWGVMELVIDQWSQGHWNADQLHGIEVIFSLEKPVQNAIF